MVASVCRHTGVGHTTQQCPPLTIAALEGVQVAVTWGLDGLHAAGRAAQCDGLALVGGQLEVGDAPGRVGQPGVGCIGL